VNNIINDIEQKGYTDRRELPAFPRTELLRIMGVNKRKKGLRGLELNEYLKSKLVCSTELLEGEITPPSASNIYTLDSLVLLLKNGNDLLNSMKVRTLHSSLNYGLWLKLTYNCFEYAKGGGLVEGSWANWLSKNVGISESYARQLRYISEKFAHYSKMHFLSISIKDLYKMRYALINMLNDQNIANFWL